MPYRTNDGTGSRDMTPAEEAAYLAGLPDPLVDAKRAWIAMLKDKRAERERAGVTSGGVMIKVDAETLITLQALKDASTPGQQVPVEQVDGTIVRVPVASLTGLITAAQARMLALRSTEATKYDEINALSTPEAVRAYDVDAGWPA